MNKILVANRGEIALRIMRTLKDMGIETVAVFSEADRNAPFVHYADEAICLGPAPSGESYLKGDKVIEVAKDLGVDGIHPGYGFLSENADFARKATEAGVTFIGPPPGSIETMGDKLSAKAAVKAYDTPLVPGTDEAVSDIEEAKNIAEEIGFPILIKASAGGGGKGMRVVDDRASFEDQMERAVSEAKSSFGDGSVFIERYVRSPRHIEIQVLGDEKGNYVHLFERECSIQRRHQKVIEEAPSPKVAPELREKMGQAAIDVARACGYVGAGTVEFLVDEHMNFYFLEMNTRLQVEHPVTEMITGKDLVREQIHIARGETLSFSQENLDIHGHAIETRVYAEDPANEFLPDIGHLLFYEAPKGPGVRVDDGYEEGMEIPIHYDPMIAKLITYGENREEAINRNRRAIQDYNIGGVSTTLSFCRTVLQHESFRSGTYDTHFVKEHFDPTTLDEKENDAAEIASLVAAKLFQEKEQTRMIDRNRNGRSRWKMRREG